MTVTRVEVTRRKKSTSTVIGEMFYSTLISSVATVWISNKKYYVDTFRKFHHAWQDPYELLYQIMLPLLTFVFICASCFRFCNFFKQYRDHNIVEYVHCSTVEIMPFLGVQLFQSTRKEIKRNTSATERTVCNRSNCQFIPRELIFDVIIVEVVSFHRVQSCLYFRVFTSTSGNHPKFPPNSNSILKHMKEGNVKLIPAFPGVNNMTYSECEKKWHSICSALGCGILPQPTKNFHHP
jgi:hypothetical protein